MKVISRVFFVVFILVLSSCRGSKEISKSSVISDTTVNNTTIGVDYVIAFGSCNRQDKPNVLWKPILSHKPEVWIWGGDNIYSDTYDMKKLESDYNTQLADKDYQKLIARTKILGTWDDHDYGLNDGGLEFEMKKESQQKFLDFFGVSKTDPRRSREGVYYSEVLHHKKGDIKVIVLDTRYFRTTLTVDTLTKKRFKPNVYGEGTILGDAQWQWLERELKTSKADFNIIVSSIQFLSDEHGFECWGNFPHEVDQLKTLIADSKAEGVLILSGDRHISEFSKAKVEGLNYDLVDFTSSGLTHSYSQFSGETNPYRVGEVVSEISFGLLKFDFEDHKILMEIRGKDDVKLQELEQGY
jgi:alkaline phosphatase D